MRRLKNFLIGILVLPILSACVAGGSSGDGNDESLNAEIEVDGFCEIPQMREWVDANMRDYYLFYDDVPQLPLQNYDNLESLVGALRVQPFDRFSYITDAAASTALFEEGVLFGFGWRLLQTSDTDVQFGFIYPRSPIAAQNVSRGDYLLAINGVDPLQMSSAQWDSFLGTGDEVVSPSFLIRDANGGEREIEVTKTEFAIDTVLHRNVFNTAAGNVGYLAFTSFLETSNAELDEAFEFFKQEQATELILDLRYNGGGRISVANNLASKIAGAAFAGSVFAEISFNDKYSNNNLDYVLNTQTEALNLDRVVVLSSSSTCSASEMIINGLKPFIDVISIGSTSCGKPYGSAPEERCGKQLNALEFRFVNAFGNGDYYQGIPADCAAADDINTALGDPQEGMLAAGIDYLTLGSCQNTTQIAAGGDATTVPGAGATDERSNDASASRQANYRRSEDPLKSEKNLY